MEWKCDSVGSSGIWSVIINPFLYAQSRNLLGSRWYSCQYRCHFGRRAHEFASLHGVRRKWVARPQVKLLSIFSLAPKLNTSNPSGFFVRSIFY